MDRRMKGSGGLLDWFVGWFDSLMEGRQAKESMNGLSDQNAIVALNSGQSAG